jgi:hypothetical protein
MSKPKIRWIEVDKDKHNWFEDGSEFLVTLMVKNKATKTSYREFHVVRTECDGDGMELTLPSGELFDAWTWFDFDYFHLISGSMPIAREDRE